MLLVASNPGRRWQPDAREVLALADPSMQANSYWLDDENRITRVSDEAWDCFARDNNGDALIGGTVLGRPLLEFITGDSTRMWVHALISYARLLGKEVSRDYRCDSPLERRQMRMTITPLEADQLRVDHHLLWSEPFSSSLDFVADGDGDVSAAHRCSICNNLRISEFWVEPHPDVLADSPPGRPCPVVYTVCPTCQESLQVPSEVLTRV